jgi:transcriptional regulator with XRE-family HTH domain
MRFMVDLSRRVLAVEFPALRDDPHVDPEVRYRSMMLGDCLRQSREANGWTLKSCAQLLQVRPKQLTALESGQFEKADAQGLGRYVALLGIEALYRQWLDANAALAAQLGLSVPAPDAARPADWPEPKPFALAPGTYRLPPEARDAVQAQLDVLLESGGLFAGLDEGQSATAPKEDPRREPAQPAVYQLKITLRHSDPEIWRRVRVPNDLTLAQLHEVIQIAMGWDNDHLHQFCVHKTRFGMSQDPMGGPLDLHDRLDEEDYRLCELELRTRSKFTYEYDFGDSWEHQIVIEKTLPHEPDGVPTCVAGARACPLEDSGGVWGYTQKLAILQDPKHPEYAELSEWMGRHFDPEAFNLDAVNRRLASLVRPQKAARRSRRRAKK